MVHHESRFLGVVEPLTSRCSGRGLRPAAERQIVSRTRSTTVDEIADIHSDVARYHSEQRRRDVTPGMKRHGGRSTVGVTILPVGPTLADLDEAQAFQDGRDFARSMVTTSSRFCRSSSTVAP